MLNYKNDIFNNSNSFTITKYIKYYSNYTLKTIKFYISYDHNLENHMKEYCKDLNRRGVIQAFRSYTKFEGGDPFIEGEGWIVPPRVNKGIFVDSFVNRIILNYADIHLKFNYNQLHYLSILLTNDKCTNFNFLFNHNYGHCDYMVTGLDLDINVVNDMFPPNVVYWEFIETRVKTLYGQEIKGR